MPPSSNSESCDDSVRKRKQLAEAIIARFYERPIFARARKVYPNLTREDIEDIEVLSYSAHYRAICLGSVAALEGVDHITAMTDANWSGCSAYVWATAERLASKRLKDRKRYQTISAEAISELQAKKSVTSPRFASFARLAFEIRDEVLRNDQIQLLKLRRQGFNFSQIAKRIDNGHDRNWVSYRLDECYSTIAVLMVHSIDPDFITLIRRAITRSDCQKRKLSDEENTEIITDSHVVPVSRDADELNDIEVVARFLKRKVNYDCRKKASKKEK